jgi:CubicO group peptidase (beta-lactamase class C family)
VKGLKEAVDLLAAETGFSGAVRVEAGDNVELAGAYGLADRAHGVPNTVETQFALASGVKGMTAVTIASLIEDGRLDLGTTARSVLGKDLPLIHDG